MAYDPICVWFVEFMSFVSFSSSPLHSLLFSSSSSSAWHRSVQLLQHHLLSRPFFLYLLLWVLFTVLLKIIWLYMCKSGLPWWLRQKIICLQCRRPGFSPWLGKIPWRRKWPSTPVFLPGKSRGQRSLAGYSPWNHKRIGHDYDLSTKQQWIALCM